MMDQKVSRFLQSGKRLNFSLITNAKPEVVDAERKKKADAESKIASLKEGIEGLRK